MSKVDVVASDDHPNDSDDRSEESGDHPKKSNDSKAPNNSASASTSDNDAAKKEKDNEQLKLRQQMEDALSEEERNQLREEATRLKAEGNDEFGHGYWYEAAKCYTEALDKCPLVFTADRAVFLSNRAACYMKLRDWDSVIKDCTEALELGAPNDKPLERRAFSYSQLEDKYEKAIEDYESLIKLRPDEKPIYIDKIFTLKKQIDARNEKLKEDMLKKLKDLGDVCLRPFGLSTDNFQLEKQPSGGYSISMKK